MGNEPITREEMFLNAVATGEAANLEPITREEMFLAKLGGADVNTPTPITRKEQFLQKAIENAGSGGSGGGAGGGGGGAAVKDAEGVNFYDYDGTLLYSYTVEEAQALTELPPLPEQPGLICQGWNWSLESIKEHNRAINVGAMYITDDGKTRIYIALREGRTSIKLQCRVAKRVVINWGDGTEEDEFYNPYTSLNSYSKQHKYSVPGDYIITLIPDEDASFRLHSGGSSGGDIVAPGGSEPANTKYAYCSSIRKVALGDKITGLESYTFQNCYNLTAISIPAEVTSIGQYVFQNCYNLSCAVIPVNCITGLYYAFSSCYRAKVLSIPPSVGAINMNAFSDCRSLQSVTIPDAVTSIGSTAFRSCSLLKSITIPKGVASIGKSAFDSCSTLKSVTIHEGVTSIGENAFLSCTLLESINIPSSITSIGSSVMGSCFILTSLSIPNSVTSISASAFSYCNAMKLYDFSTHTSVPTLANTNAFSNIPSDCEIRVPAALYDEWIAATNWATYASNIVAV